MDGWRDGYMDAWPGGLVNGWMHEWKTGRALLKLENRWRESDRAERHFAVAVH